MSRPAAYVFIDLDGVVRPVGTLRSARGRETASFHYASEWLNAQHRFALQPALETNVARSIAADVATTVSTWRSAAAELGLKRGEIERMESAFEHADLASALQ